MSSRRGIRHLALGQADVAALEQGPHAVVAGLAVDVREVVGIGVGLRAVGLEERREQPRPRVHVHDRGGRQHAVEVEQPSADAAQVDLVGGDGRCGRVRAIAGVAREGHGDPFVRVGRGAGTC